MSFGTNVAETRLYFDTSVLSPLYREEPLTAQVEKLQSEITPVISALTEVEVASALARWVRTAELTKEQARRLETTFDIGLNAYHGDASACLVRDGRIIAVAEEERFRRGQALDGFSVGGDLVLSG